MTRLTAPLSPQELEDTLRAIGRERYHNLHPFHHLLHGGKLSLDQVRAWALNRYCYQAAIPRKDAALISKIHDRELRRVWAQRIIDHDGREQEEGGIERWLLLTDGLGLPRDYVISRQGALPATVFAVEAYVHFVAEHSPVVAVSSCLTELFARPFTKNASSACWKTMISSTTACWPTSAAGWTKRRAMPILPWTTSSATR